MSEYTPTTEEARNAWVCCIFESGGAWVSDAAYEDARWDEERAEAQFDRWLAAEKSKWQAEAWERGYMFAFAQERGDHTHSRPVPDYLADDIRSWNPYLTSLNQTQG